MVVFGFSLTNCYFLPKGKHPPPPANWRTGGFYAVMRLLPLLLSGVLTTMVKGISAPWTQADADLKSLQSCVEMFRIHVGRYPSGEEGLKALVEPPPGLSKPNRWQRSCDMMPQDPWGHFYGYVEGSGFASGYGLYSMGPDGKSATQGNDPDDINSWSDHVPIMPPSPWFSIFHRDLPVAGLGFLLGILACRIRKTPS